MSTSDVEGVCENLEACKLDEEAKISDEDLFKHPPPREDCQICFIRLPVLHTGYKYKSCCGKVICSGCIHAPVHDDQGNKVNIVKQNECAFCRVVAPYTIGEAVERMSKRVKADDPIAIFNLGGFYRGGLHGYPQDYTKALELYHQAVELGYAKAYCSVGYAYDNGKGVEVNEKKARHYYQLAAIEGSERARHNLGSVEGREGNMDRAIKHYMIAVRGGESDSLEMIKQLYLDGHATKEDYTKALRAYQEYLGEIKSVQRDEAAAAREDYRYY